MGHARVGAEEQATARRPDEPRAAGRAELHTCGAACGRPTLARALAHLRPGDTLIVVSLDRLARPLSHLLEVVECDREGRA